MSAEALPPLPELEIDGMTRKHLDQETVDRALRAIYERRPDFLVKMAKREGTRTEPNDAFNREFRRFVHEDLKISGSLSRTSRIIWEARRRARLMYGMPI